MGRENDHMSRAKIIDKVKKLLALAKGTNYEGETAMAMNRARELLAKYNLSMTDIEEKQAAEENPEERLATSITAGSWQTSIASIVTQYYNCEYFYRIVRGGGRSRRGKRIITIVGMPTEVELAEYTLISIVDQVDKMMRKARKKLRKEREANGLNRQNRADSSFYTRGYAIGIVKYLRDSLKKQVEEEKCRALVLVKNPKVRQYMNSLNLKLTRPRPFHPSSAKGFNDGYRDGKKVNVRRGIKGRGEGPAISIPG